MLYVYGVIRSSGPPNVRLAGLEGAPVTTVDSSRVGALVTPLRRPPEGLARDLRAHWRVLQVVMEQTTVLPLRFGTVMESADAVQRDFLVPSEAELGAMLDEMKNQAQFAISGTYDPEVRLRHMIQRSPAVRELRAEQRRRGATMGQQIQLGELVASELERLRQADIEDAVEHLGPVATDVRHEAVRGDDAAFNLAFLVSRRRRSRFDEAVSRLRDHLTPRITLRYVGPLPPYSFVDLGSEERAWA